VADAGRDRAAVAAGRVDGYSPEQALAMIMQQLGGGGMAPQAGAMPPMMSGAMA